MQSPYSLLPSAALHATPSPGPTVVVVSSGTVFVSFPRPFPLVRGRP